MGIIFFIVLFVMLVMLAYHTFMIAFYLIKLAWHLCQIVGIICFIPIAAAIDLHNYLQRRKQARILVEEPIDVEFEDAPAALTFKPNRKGVYVLDRR